MILNSYNFEYWLYYFVFPMMVSIILSLYCGYYIGLNKAKENK